MFLEFRTIPVATAASVLNVKRLLNEKEISLICTDWDLGDGTGLDVLQLDSEKNTPVVFFTGHDEDSYKEKAMSLGLQDINSAFMSYWHSNHLHADNFR